MSEIQICIQNSKFIRHPIFCKNSNFCQKSNFLSKIQTFVKNPIFCQKNKFLSKIQIFVKNPNFCQKSKFLSKNFFIKNPFFLIQKTASVILGLKIILFSYLPIMSYRTRSNQPVPKDPLSRLTDLKKYSKPNTDDMEDWVFAG